VLLDLGARPNREPLDNMQRKTTRVPTAGEKPVRPVSETGQTASVGLSLSIGKETGQTGSANRSGRFCPELPQNPSNRKPASGTSPPLNKNDHCTTETFSLKNFSRQPTWLNRSDRFGKPVRPVLPGQSGKTQPAEKLKTPSDHLPIHSTDQSVTLG
jgi:hypothetical protein